MLGTIRVSALLRLASIATLCGALGACASTPQWANPGTWVDGVFGGSESPPPADPAAPADAASATQDGYPVIGDAPQPPQPSTTEDERRAVVDSLVADREKAQHSLDTLRGGSEPAAPPPPPAQASDDTEDPDEAVTPAAPPE